MDITITGEARTEMAPQRATVTLTVAAEGRDRSRVLNETQASAQRLLGELESQPQTVVTSFSTDGVRSYSWHPQGQRQLTHSASCSIRATFVDFARMAELTSAWAEQGVEIGHTTWELTMAQRQSALETLLGQALDAARAKAELIASHLGAGPISIVTVTDDSSERNLQQRVMFAATGRSVADPVEARPEDIELTTSLTVVFRAG